MKLGESSKTESSKALGLSESPHGAALSRTNNE